MTATSVSRIIVLAFVAAGGIALVFAKLHISREPLMDPKAATVAPTVPKPAFAAQEKPASAAQDNGLDAIAAAQAKVDAVTAALGGPPDSGDGGPTFDIARVEPTGEAVIAGRATPGATVELLRNGELHDRAVADQSGQFVMVPPRLPTGAYDLTLRSKQPEGKQAISKQSVTGVIEPIPTDQPVVALMTPGKPTVVLSQPPAPTPLAGAVVVESVEIEPGGQFHASGRARAGAAVRLYLNDTFVASVKSGTDGRFAVTINEGVAPGSYRVRLDEMAPNSSAVRTRAEVPFNVTDAMVKASVAARAKAFNARPCRRTAAATGSRRYDRSTGRRLVLDRRRAEDRNRHRLTRRQPLAPQPPHLWCGHAVRHHLQGEQGADPAIRIDLPRPDLCPSSALRVSGRAALAN